MNINEEDPGSATERGRALKEAYLTELMSKENVVGVGVGFQEKDGQKTDTVALVVMVERKIPKSLLAPEDLLPHEIEGFPVDVQEVGMIRAF